jgi:hypothetical protein
MDMSVPAMDISSKTADITGRKISVLAIPRADFNLSAVSIL